MSFTPMLVCFLIIIIIIIIAGNFRWCKFLRKSVQTLQKKFSRFFIFADMGAGLSGHTPISWWPRPICETALNDEAKKQACATTAWSSFGVETFEITKVSRLPPRARNRRVGLSTADLDFDNCGTSHGILYSSRLILLYSNHLGGRQTVENHLVHIGTNSYRRAHVMTSSISILVHFFAVFNFAEAGLSAKIAKIWTQRKFPAIRYYIPLYGIWSNNYHKIVHIHSLETKLQAPNCITFLT